MSTSPPLVSVVVPAFNAASTVMETLASVRGQTMQSFEVIVVDDGSSDDTFAIAQTVARDDPRFRVIRQANAGVGAARNAGLRLARGRYFAPLDADDLWSPSKLAQQLAVLESAGPHMGYAYCWSERIDWRGASLGFTRPYILAGNIALPLVLRHFTGNASTPLFRLSALEQVGVYLTRAEQAGAQGCEDWDLELRVAERFAVGFAPDYLVGYRQSATCMSTAARSMAGSYRTTMARVRQRNSALAACYFRWSAGIFYHYLSRRCRRARNARGALWAATHAVVADPATLLSSELALIGARSAMHVLTGGVLRQRHQRRTTTPVDSRSRPAGWFDRLQARRWAHALSSTAPTLSSAPLPSFRNRADPSHALSH